MNTTAPITAAKLPAGWELSVFADEISPDLSIQLEETARAGLHFFDLRSAFNKNVLDLTDAEADRVREAAAVHSLEVKCIGSPVNKHPFNPEDRNRELDRMRRIAAIANRVGARYIRIFTPFVSGGPRAPEFEEMRDWLADQIEVAKTEGVVLLHENDADCYMAFPDRARRLLEDLGCKQFRAVFDFSNAVLLGYPALPHWFPWIMPHLEALHIKDSLAAKDEDGQDQIVPAGEGEGRIREVLIFLVEQGWRGPVSIEPHLWKIGKKRGLDGIGQFRLALEGLNRSLEGLTD